MPYWVQVRDPCLDVALLYWEHYSCKRPYESTTILPPGERILLLGRDKMGAFAWIRNTIPRDDGLTGINCSLFINTGGHLSSMLILEAELWARERWPQAGTLFTYVNPRAVASPNPGYCFKRAGWRTLRKDGRVHRSVRKHVVLFKDMDRAGVA